MHTTAGRTGVAPPIPATRPRARRSIAIGLLSLATTVGFLLVPPSSVGATTSFAVKVVDCPGSSGNVCFAPSTLPGVAPGDSVTWTNMTSASRAIVRCTRADCPSNGSGNGSDNLGSQALGKGESYTHVFSAGSGGSYYYTCEQQAPGQQAPKTAPLCPGSPVGEVVVGGTPSPTPGGTPTPAPTPVVFNPAPPSATPTAGPAGIATQAPTDVPTDSSQPVAVTTPSATPSPSDSVRAPLVEPVTPQPGSRLPLVVAILVVLALIGGAAAWLLRRRRSASP